MPTDSHTPTPPKGEAKKLFIWLARAFEAGIRDWQTLPVLADLAGVNPAKIAASVTAINSLPAPIASCMIQQRNTPRRAGNVEEYRLTDDGLLYALDVWPDKTLEPLAKDAAKKARDKKQSAHLAKVRNTKTRAEEVIQ